MWLGALNKLPCSALLTNHFSRGHWSKTLYHNSGKCKLILLLRTPSAVSCWKLLLFENCFLLEIASCWKLLLVGNRFLLKIASCWKSLLVENCFLLNTASICKCKIYTLPAYHWIMVKTRKTNTKFQSVHSPCSFNFLSGRLLE